MHLLLIMNMDNDAFKTDEGANHEAANVLNKVQNQLRDGTSSGTLMDHNGNSIGKWEITE